MYERWFVDLLLRRVKEKRKRTQVVLGPRQVGKTTVVSQLLKKIDVPKLYVSADGPVASDSAWIEQQWQLARFQLKKSEAAEFLLVIDEVQKVGDWSNAVKALWDEDSFNKVGIKVFFLVLRDFCLSKVYQSRLLDGSRLPICHTGRLTR